MAERYKRNAENQAGWDRYFVIVIQFIFIGWIIIMPLDAKRYVWSSGFPLAVEIIGTIMLLFSSFLFFRSYKDNSFLSPLVRIQTDRRHKVVSTGVYSFVRHPMYLAGILLFFGTPMLLGSVFGLFASVIFLMMVMVRIVGEEKHLASELDGYGEYKVKVRYRLIPYIW